MNLLEDAEDLDEVLLHLASSLKIGRQLSLSVAPLDKVDRPCSRMSLDSFDAVFAAYNEACSVIIDDIARRVESVNHGSLQGCRAARRYRLFSSAAEHLSKDRAFMGGHTANAEGMPKEMSQRLFEIIGARKVLLGTAAGASCTHATNGGLVGFLIAEGEPSLLSATDLNQLEYLEAQVLAPSEDEALPTTEWYRTLTRLLNGIHSRIALSLVADMRKAEPVHKTGRLDGRRSLPATILETRLATVGTPLPRVISDSLEERLAGIQGETKRETQDPCGCKAGLRKILQSLLDKL
jgi:hypothetical protein